MSSIAAIYLRDMERDTVYIATDTLASMKNEVNINGKTLPESLCAFASKIYYHPHLKTVIASLGTGYLACKITGFVQDMMAIQSVDELIYAIETKFSTWLKQQNDMPDIVLDSQAPDFIGLLSITGLSSEEIDVSHNEVRRRARSILITTKLMVYKDKVVNGGLINNAMDSYGDNLIYSFPPKLDSDFEEGIFQSLEPLLSSGNEAAYPILLTEVLKEAHRKYNETGRNTLVSGGDVIITKLDNPKDGIFTCLQYTSHRFGDFEENRKEMISNRKRIYK